MKEFLTVLIEDDEDDVFFFQRAMQKVDWPGAIQILAMAPKPSLT